MALLPGPRLLSAHLSNRHLSLPSSKSWPRDGELPPASNHFSWTTSNRSLTVPKPTRAHPQAFALPLSLPLLLPAWPLLFFDFWLKQWFCGRAQTSG